MYIGNYNKNAVRIIEGVQKGVLLTGPPGTGKSCRLHKIEYEHVKAGGTAIVIDVTPAHTSGRIFSEISSVYEPLTNRIDAVRDGLDIPVLSPFRDEKGEEESSFRIVNSVVSSLSNHNYGHRQIGELREAVIAAMKIKRNYSTMQDIDVIKTVLDNKKLVSDSAEGIYQRLWPMFYSGIFRQSDKCLKPQKINVIDFSGVDTDTAALSANMLLATLWRMAYFAGFDRAFGTTIVVIDECRLLPLKPDSPIGLMLSLGRKFGVNLALALQSLNVLTTEERSVVDMTATKLYFKPEQKDRKIIKTEMEMILGARASRFSVGDLQVGEAIAMGPLECGGYPVNGAILTS